MRFYRSCLATLMLAAAAACATAPEPALPFADRLAAAEAAGNPYEVDAALTELLADPKLKTEERAEALYQRGSLRRLAGDDRRGAVTDLEAMLALAPEYQRAGQAEIELDLARSDLEALEPRLGYMLTLPQWFDVSWTLGDREAPARRYQKAGISPTETQTQKLADAGFICGPDGAGGPVQGAGDLRDWLEDLTWCNPMPAPVEVEAEPQDTGT
jgi:GNAT superfamily N-acetyltransferase